MCDIEVVGYKERVVLEKPLRVKPFGCVQVLF